MAVSHRCFSMINALHYACGGHVFFDLKRRKSHRTMRAAVTFFPRKKVTNEVFAEINSPFNSTTHLLVLRGTV
jgi:hypothetical protein